MECGGACGERILKSTPLRSPAADSRRSRQGDCVYPSAHLTWGGPVAGRKESPINIVARLLQKYLGRRAWAEEDQNGVRVLGGEGRKQGEVEGGGRPRAGVAEHFRRFRGRPGVPRPGRQKESSASGLGWLFAVLPVRGSAGAAPKSGKREKPRDNAAPSPGLAPHCPWSEYSRRHAVLCSVQLPKRDKNEGKGEKGGKNETKQTPES